MGMLIHGPISTAAIDSSGEVVNIEGADISDFLEGRAYANWEHNNNSAENLVGIFRYAKKILSEKDCETPIQKEFWNQIKMPFIYGICELFDDEEHPGAVAIGAMLRYFKKRKEKIQIGFSTEGLTLERDGNKLNRTVMRRAAITLRPCNRTCWIDVLEDPEALKLNKSDELNIGRNTTCVTVDVDLFDNEKDSPLQMAFNALKRLQKTLTAGMVSAAPDSLVQGSALQAKAAKGSIDQDTKNKIKAAIRDWNRVRPLKEVIKAALPEISDDYLEHFVEIAQQLMLKKNLAPELKRISVKDIISIMPSSEQQRLVEGIYFSPEHQLQKFKNITFQNDAGQKILLNINPLAIQLSLYSKLARDVLRMIENVPIMSAISCPNTDGPILACEKYTGNILSNVLKYKNINNDLLAQSHKLFANDFILGNDDRKSYMVMLSDDGKLINIDSNSIFNYRPHNDMHYSYFFHGIYNYQHMPLSPIVYNWLKDIDYKYFARQLLEHGIDKNKIIHAVRRLRMLQNADKTIITPKQIIEKDAIYLLEHDQ